MTFDSSGNQVENCTSLSLTVNTPATITNAQFFCMNNFLSYNDQCQLTFLTVNPLSTNSAIRITFPSEMSLNLLSTNAVVGQTGVKLGPLSYSTIGSNTLLITDGVNNYKASGTNFTIVIRNVQLPSTTATTSSFVVNTETSTGALVSKISTGLTYKALPGVINSVTITATDPTVKSTTTFKFLFTPTNSLPTTAGVRITFPPELLIANQASGACVSGDTSTVNPNPSCSASSQVLTVSGLFSTAYTGGNQIGFTVNLVTNPSSTKPTSTFTIQTYSDITSTATLTDQSTSATYAATNYATLTLSTISVVPSSYLVSTVSTYVFTFQNQNRLFAQGAIFIQLPPTITIPIISNTQNSFVALSSLSSSATIAVTSTDITITNAVTSDLAAGSTISFSFQGLQNPETLQPTTSFTIITKTSDGYLIDGISSGVIVTMTSVPTFYHIQITPTSYNNYETTTYRFAITVRNPHYTGDYLEITFPLDIQFPNIPTCNPVSNLLAFTTVCVKSGQNLVVTPNFSPSTLPVQTVFIFDVPSCTNPLSLEPFSSFQIASYSSTNYKREETLTGLVFTTVANTISTISASPLDYVPGETTSYTINFQPIVPIPSTGTIGVRIPPEIQVSSSPTCVFNQGVLGASASCSYSSGTRMLTINSGGPFSSSINFTITGLTNPSSGTSSTFEVYTYTSSGYIIDQKVNSLIYQFPCSSSCRTCLSSSASNCTSCFSSPASTKNYLYYGTCVTACPADAPPDSSNVCTPCGTGCLTCDSVTGACTSCSNGYELVNGQCTQTSGLQALFAAFQNGVAPFPFLISAGVLFLLMLIACQMLKTMTFTSNLLAFYGLVEFAAIVTFLLLLFIPRASNFSLTKADTDIILTVAALILNYFLNFGLIIYYCLKVRSDAKFIEWRVKEGVGCCSELILVISAITSLKFFPFFHGKFLRFEVFSAKCSSTGVLVPLSVLMGLHSLLTGGTAAAAGVLNIINSGIKAEQVTVLAIELPVVVVLTFIVYLFEIRKPKDYFEPKLTDNDKYLKVDDESKVALGSALKASEAEKMDQSTKKSKDLEQPDKKTDPSEKKEARPDRERKSSMKELFTQTSLQMKEPTEKPVVKAETVEPQLLQETPLIVSGQKNRLPPKPHKPLGIQRQDLISVQHKTPSKVSDPLLLNNEDDDDIPTLRKGATLPINRQKVPLAQDRTFDNSVNDSKLDLLSEKKRESQAEQEDEEAEEVIEQVKPKKEKESKQSKVLDEYLVQDLSQDEESRTKRSTARSPKVSNTSQKQYTPSVKDQKKPLKVEQKPMKEEPQKKPLEKERNQKSSSRLRNSSKRQDDTLEDEEDLESFEEERPQKNTRPTKQKTETSNRPTEKYSESPNRKSASLKSNTEIRNSTKFEEARRQERARGSLESADLARDRISSPEKYSYHTENKDFQSYHHGRNPTSTQEHQPQEENEKLRETTNDWKPEIYSKDVGDLKPMQNNSFVDPSYIPDNERMKTYSQKNPTENDSISAVDIKSNSDRNAYQRRTNTQGELPVVREQTFHYVSYKTEEDEDGHSAVHDHRAENSWDEEDQRKIGEEHASVYEDASLRDEHRNFSSPSTRKDRVQNESRQYTKTQEYTNRSREEQTEDENEREDKREVEEGGSQAEEEERRSIRNDNDDEDEEEEKHEVELEQNNSKKKDSLSVKKNETAYYSQKKNENVLKSVHDSDEVKPSRKLKSMSNHTAVKKQGNLEAANTEYLQNKKLKSRGDRPTDDPKRDSRLLKSFKEDDSTRNSQLNKSNQRESARLNDSKEIKNSIQFTNGNESKEIHENPLDNMSDHGAENNQKSIYQEDHTIDLGDHPSQNKINSSSLNNSKIKTSTVKNNFFESNKKDNRYRDSEDRHEQESSQKIDQSTKKQEANLLQQSKGVKQEVWASPPTHKTKPKYEVDDHSDIIVGASHEFVNEDTPSNYDAMNQRFDELTMQKPSGFQPHYYRNLLQGPRDLLRDDIQLPQLRNQGNLFKPIFINL